MSSWWQSMTQFFSDLGTGVLLKSFTALICAGVMNLFDMAHPSVRPLVYLMLIDFALGAIHAWEETEFSFAGIRKGVRKFVNYGVALIVTSLADWGVGIEGTSSLTWAFCVFLIACEALSCLRHLCDFGLNLPNWLFVRLEYLKKSGENPGRRSEDWRGRRSANADPETVSPRDEEENHDR